MTTNPLRIVKVDFERPQKFQCSQRVQWLCCTPRQFFFVLSSDFSLISPFLFLRNQALIGLVLMSVGSGGIMACDVSLGADQFRLPQQQAEIITGETKVSI